MDVTKTYLITFEPANERVRKYIQNFLSCLRTMPLVLCFVRFKDKNIIDKSIYGYDKNLELSNVTGLMGRYQCRVVNDYGAEFSDIADLRVFSK